MPEVFTLHRDRGSVSHTLADWGAITPTLTLNGQGATSQSVDALTFATALKVDASSPFQYQDRIELWGADGKRRFVGWAKFARKKCAPDSERQTFTFEGPAQFFRSSYEAAANFKDGESLALQSVTSFVLNAEAQADGTLLAITLYDQLDRIFTFVKNYGNAGSAAPVDYDLTGVPAAWLCEVPSLNATCSAVVEALQALCPSLQLRWDYTYKINGSTLAEPGDPPILRCVNILTIDSGGSAITPSLSGGGNPVVHSIANDGSILREFAPTPEDERLVGTMQVICITDDGSGNAVSTSQTSTIANGSPVRQVITLTLRSAVWNGTSFLAPENVPPTNIARLLHQGGYDRVWWTIKDGTTGPAAAHRWEWRPGDLVNITSAGDDLALAYAMIQSVTCDLLTGATSLDTGAPSQRGLGKLAQLRRAGGEQPIPSGGQQATGKKPGPDALPPGTPGSPGADGATPVLYAGTLAVGSSFAIAMPLHAPSLIDKDVNLTVPPVKLNSFSLGTTGGSGSITIGGDWAAGFTIDVVWHVDVTALDAGETPTFSISGNTLSIGIPKGETGPAGAPGEVTTAAMNAAIAAALAAQQAAILAANPSLASW